MSNKKIEVFGKVFCRQAAEPAAKRKARVMSPGFKLAKIHSPPEAYTSSYGTISPSLESRDVLRIEDYGNHSSNSIDEIHMENIPDGLKTEEIWQLSIFFT